MPSASTPAAVAPPSATAPSATVVLGTLSAPSASSRARPRDVHLAEERALLEVARTALARGQPDAAFASLEKHKQTFPSGRLVEEREVLAIEALAELGRGPEARERAARFRRAYPESILLPAVEASLQTIP